jgi:26S proteasome regulatory subunit T5
MEVDEKPTEDYSDIGGLDKQIQELVEAIVLPVTHKERFKALGIRPPKGVLLYGPPGTGTPPPAAYPVLRAALCVYSVL